jgi:predicted DNA-binding transcriptional regulator YafY
MFLWQDNCEELRISLNLYITHDLKMEILSYGDSVKILAPESFANEMKKSLTKTAEKY